MPGFDPGRALARPTGEFVLLRDARIGLVDRARRPARSTAARLLVNRYVVDRVEADLMLGFFFPGAEMVLTGAAAARRDQAAATAAPARDDRRRVGADRAGRRSAGRNDAAGRLPRGVDARARGPISPGRPPPSGWTGLRCGMLGPGAPRPPRGTARIGPPRSGRGSTFRSGMKPSSTVHGIAFRSSRWTPRSRSVSSMQTRLIASPVAPARPVRPIRWM